MDLPALIDALGKPDAYPFMVGTVSVKQTHISAVFLAGDFVYKLKKPVANGFLDFTTLAKRLHYCREEVRLNRRMAPDVYLGVVPVAMTPEGVRLERDGEVVEWAVKMRRLPDDATLLDRLQRSEIDNRLVEAVAVRIAEFHRNAETSDHIASFGRFDVVARNIRDVFDRAGPGINDILGEQLFERIRTLAETTLNRLKPVIESRATRNVTRDCHGDLHLDHVYCFPGEPAPNDLVIIDCIEFNEPFRFIDPVADMAFAVMDFAFQGRRDLARIFSEAYFQRSGDEEGRLLLPLFAAYRSCVRAMVDGLLLREPEVPVTERAQALTRCRAHWLLALAELESPDRRPCLLLVAGLPGTGKSTLARMLGEQGGFEVIRSDVVRKALAEVTVDQPAPAVFRESIYQPEFTERTYSECLTRARRLLGEGRRVIVDANFREDRWRELFLKAALHDGVPAAVLVCEASREAARSRLSLRKGDASDADWEVYLRISESWEQPGEFVRRLLRGISSEGTPGEVLERAIEWLRHNELGTCR